MKLQKKEKQVQKIYKSLARKLFLSEANSGSPCLCQRTLRMSLANSVLKNNNNNNKKTYNNNFWKFFQFKKILEENKKNRII